MRRLFLLPTLLVLLLSAAVVLGIGATQSKARASVAGGSAGRACPGDGVPPTSAFTPPNPEIVPYLFGDPRLGPKYLPRHGTIGRMLASYRRFTVMGPRKFLGCYWRTGPPYANWRYPKDNGFLVIDGKPVEHKVVLRRGQEIDLFGNPGNPADPAANKGGQFLSPAGTPYRYRAIPPTNLDTYSASAPFNYHLYKVDKKFSVMAGPAAPWFDQPGGGIQGYLGGTTGPGLPSSPGIANLANQGYVQEVPVSQ